MRSSLSGISTPLEVALPRGGSVTASLELRAAPTALRATQDSILESADRKLVIPLFTVDVRPLAPQLRGQWLEACHHHSLKIIKPGKIAGLFSRKSSRPSQMVRPCST